MEKLLRIVLPVLFRGFTGRRKVDQVATDDLFKFRRTPLEPGTRAPRPSRLAAISDGNGSFKPSFQMLGA